MRAAELSLEIHGACYLPGLTLPLLDSLRAIADRFPMGRAGTRIAGDPDVAAVLAEDGLIGGAVSRLADRTMQPVRAVLFDKTENANWALAWHQDRTIAVKERCDVPGYGPWTVKQGIVHVQPPYSLTQRMLTVRIHLDDVDRSNAPLLIALRSHLLGLVPVKRVGGILAQSEAFACLAKAGDAWIYATPILHASQAAAPGRRRRVLQVDFSDFALPSGMNWLGV